MKITALKFVRLQKRISINKLSKQAGINKGTLYRYDIGILCPTQKTMEKIRIALDVPIEQITGYRNMNPFDIKRAENYIKRPNPKEHAIEHKINEFLGRPVFMNKWLKIE